MCCRTPGRRPFISSPKRRRAVPSVSISTTNCVSVAAALSKICRALQSVVVAASMTGKADHGRRRGGVVVHQVVRRQREVRLALEALHRDQSGGSLSSPRCCPKTEPLNCSTTTGVCTPVAARHGRIDHQQVEFQGTADVTLGQHAERRRPGRGGLRAHRQVCRRARVFQVRRAAARQHGRRRWKSGRNRTGRRARHLDEPRMRIHLCDDEVGIGRVERERCDFSSTGGDDIPGAPPGGL